jgi:hypothetical protein
MAMADRNSTPLAGAAPPFSADTMTDAEAMLLRPQEGAP